MLCLIPYKSTKMNLDLESTELTITAPWMDIVVEVERENLNKTKSTIEKIANKKYDEDTYELMDFFSEFPLWTALPNENLEWIQLHANKNLIDESTSINEFLVSQIGYEHEKSISWS